MPICDASAVVCADANIGKKVKAINIIQIFMWRSILKCLIIFWIVAVIKALLGSLLMNYKYLKQQSNNLDRFAGFDC